jgi:hypothetical protein
MGIPPFNATIALLGINPYVSVPGPTLKRLFLAAGRDKSPIPVKVTIEGINYCQTLVRYQGDWRLYLNTPMRKAACKNVGDRLKLSVQFDPSPREERLPTEFKQALKKDATARLAFEQLSPSRQKEIVRYLNTLKTKLALERNVATVLLHLRGESPKTLGALMRTTKTQRKPRGSRK